MSNAIGVKAPGNFQRANLALMRERLRAIGDRFERGLSDRLSFYAQMKAEIKIGATAQFRAALGRPANKQDLITLNGVLWRHGEYLRKFVGETVGQDKMSGVAARATLYGGAATEAGAAGTVTSAAPRDRIRWVGPDGPSSCRNCLRYIGRDWTLGEFQALGIMPGRGTACAGNCRCRLEVIE